MMNFTRLTQWTLRPLVRLKRLPHRQGYGVHSPFAFSLIRHVIGEHLPYYSYDTLRREAHRQAASHPHGWNHEPLRVKQLLFRLVNFARPELVVDAGMPTAAALYLQAARTKADYLQAAQTDELYLERGRPVDFLYLHDFRRPHFVREVLQVCLPRTAAASLFVIEGIGYSAAMRRLWREVQRDPRVRVSFDLHDLGLLFFDPDKQRQHYVVSF